MRDSLIVQASMDQLDTVLGKVEQILEMVSCPMKLINKINVCVEELFVNVVNYAYTEDVTNKLCEITLDATEGKLVIRMEDEGVPFDPFSKEDPDITLSAYERPIGGLGIFMVKNIMDNVSYSYEGNRNITIIEKNW